MALKKLQALRVKNRRGFRAVRNLKKRNRLQKRILRICDRIFQASFARSAHGLLYPSSVRVIDPVRPGGRIPDEATGQNKYAIFPTGPWRRAVSHLKFTPVTTPRLRLRGTPRVLSTFFCFYGREISRREPNCRFAATCSRRSIWRNCRHSLRTSFGFTCLQPNNRLIESECRRKLDLMDRGGAIAQPVVHLDRNSIRGSHTLLGRSKTRRTEGSAESSHIGCSSRPGR